MNFEYFNDEYLLVLAETDEAETVLCVKLLSFYKYCKHFTKKN